ncbi:hypothetical protein M2152_000663 [Microbacteriaceae bacterium SG_E_30_P1]|uniref:Uncharacterized protein n=1 Tax=Antiquaquibacter oligotrophicus TaxID=2880260 RepID=A0ABT6KKI8_9MICO|nr:hypothetical protein [Antiquaquibacter oligotrophicus]MDH6180481.1 hypothetical protein [Antiquaquibacter oligotrophicus]UDF13782.1 hypothetical protein LH407_02700 [Antiquaquibacter oligotrophicus]
MSGQWTMLPGTSTGLVVARPLSVNLEQELIRRGSEVAPLREFVSAALERTYDGALVLVLDAASGFSARILLHDGARPVLHEVTRQLLLQLIPLTSIPPQAVRPALSRAEVTDFVADPHTLAARVASLK